MDGDDEVLKDAETLLEEGLFRVMKDDNRYNESRFSPYSKLTTDADH